MARSLGWALLLAALAAPAGWWVSDRLERDNSFCVSCHLRPQVALHAAKREDLVARPPASLAAAHGAAGVSGRPFRCIDCHGGSGLVGRARVKALSVKDAFWYAVGRFDEPDRMRWPLWDADCRKCHGEFAELASPPASRGRDPDFHELAVHNRGLGVRCVECHLSHAREGLAEHDFLLPEVVRARCAECHPEFE